MEANEIRKTYSSKTTPDEVLQKYKEIEDKEAVDTYNYDNSLLHIAAQHAHVGAINYLLEEGILSNVVNKYGKTPLHLLAEMKYENFYKPAKGDIYAATRRLLEAKVSPLRKDDDGVSCLHEAADRANYEFLQAMADAGAKLDMTDKKGNTPLHVVCDECSRATHGIFYAEQNLRQAEENAAKSEHRIYQEHVEHAKERLQKEFDTLDAYFFCAKALIDGGVDVDEKNSYGQTAQDLLFHDDRRGDKRIAALIGGYYTENPEGEDLLRLQTGGMGIHKAITMGDIEAVAANIKLGADLNALYDSGSEYDKFNGLSPLATAIVFNDVQAVTMLLEAGADPNYKDSNDRSAVSFWFHVEGSIRTGSKVFEEKLPHNILKQLKKHKFDFEASIDQKGHTLLNGACAELNGARGYNSFSIPGVVIEHMLGWGADVNKPNLAGITPLMYICKCDRSSAENVQISLLEAGADVNARDENGNTPLMYAARHRDKAMAKNMTDMLFNFGKPDLAAVNNHGQTALEIATAENNEPLVKYLLGKM